jgi:hypothetical protein
MYVLPPPLHTRSLSNPTELTTSQQNQFLRVLKKLTMGAGIMVEMPLLRLLRFVPITAVQEMFNANDYILAGASRAVEMARSRTGEANIFAKVIEDSDKDGTGHIDDMDVRIEAMNIIIAGTDTSGVTLTYLTWAVLQRPDLQRALEAEVRSLPEAFNENDLVALPLLNAVIDETLRLYGAAPSSLPRVVPPGGATLGGRHVPQGVTVDTQAYTFHRDPEIWRDPLMYVFSSLLLFYVQHPLLLPPSSPFCIQPPTNPHQLQPSPLDPDLALCASRSAIARRANSVPPVRRRRALVHRRAPGAHGAAVRDGVFVPRVRGLAAGRAHDGAEHGV